MPFIQRIVEPVYLSRQSLHKEEGASAVVTEHELEAVTNTTLSNALRQLASLVVTANEIFDDLAKQLQDVSERANKLRTRTDLVEQKVSAFDPKTVTVPEGDLCDFSARTTHFCARRDAPPRLFSAETRPAAVRRLYEAAARTPVPLMRELDHHRDDGRRSSRFFLCTPVLGERRRRHARLRSADLDIETRTPAAVAALRRWTSAEALGDVTALPDCSVRLAPAADDADETDHRLPSPEEQLATVALRFPGHVVAVDVSGRAFQRMSLVRRSQQLGPGAAGGGGGGGGGGGRARRARHKRRNTLAGTDRREIRQALAREAEREAAEAASASASAALRPAASSDLLAPRPSTSASSTPDGDSGSGASKKLSHLRSLKQWAGRAKLRLTRRDAAAPAAPAGAAAPAPPPEAASTAPAPPPMPTQPSASQPHAVNVYESVGSHLPIAASSGPLSVAVKLREKRDQAPPLHSSSGNWSASSESGRASLGSSTSTSHQPRSTTTVSSATGVGHTLNTSASSSGTLTPDLAASIADQDSSSVYSCDTEGYYTSFHLDSGLKPLREEDPVAAAAAAGGSPSLTRAGAALGPSGTLLPQQALHSTCALSTGGSPNRTLTADSEYELFGKGSTSTTTSSAGTVCTTLQLSEGSPSTGPAVPERKSSLLVAADVHADSPDSGHNTSSSPAQSASPPGTLTVRSRSRSSDCDFSESDLEAVERVERIRVKTAINSSRIPSMCVITPPQSDDEAGTGASAPSSPPTQQRAPQTTTTTGRRPAYEKQLSSDSESDWAAIVRKERRPHLNLNGVIGKVKDAFTGKKSPESQPAPAQSPTLTTAAAQQDAGDYVTIADVRPRTNYKPSSPRLYSNAAAVSVCRPTEYVSLNELPPPETTRSGAPLAASPPPGDSLERRRRQGARVTLDSEGRVVYSSDSLRRRGKSGHTTFEPGPYVKEPSAAGSPMMGHRASAGSATVSHPPPTSPQLGKVIIRAATPSTCVSAQRPLSPPPVQQQQQQQSQQQRPGAYVNVQSPTRSAPDNRDTEEGRNPTYGKEPPRYVSPPQAVWSNTIDHTQHGRYSTPYWTLPARRSQDKLDMECSGKQINMMQQNPGSGRFNTIATSSCRNYVDNQRNNEYRNTLPYQHSVCATQLYSNTHRGPVATTNRLSACGMPASETVQQNYNPTVSVRQGQQTENMRQSFFSSTPTKSGTMSMNMSTNFSPIPRQSVQNDNENTFKAYSNTHLQGNHVRVASPRLISPPRTSMTAEEIFAAIHKSKKRLNIKTDSDSYSRSASPSCSSATSLSPGSSESSLCGLQGRAATRYTPETGTFNNRNENGRNRHSWSPNASEEEVLRQSLESRSPIQLPGSRQSWACDRLGSIQQTSRNDFKRLLLQQSSKSNISSMTGYPGTKLSAVEQLKLSRQKMVSATINTNGCYSSRSPAEKRNGGSKLLSSPRALATWRFSSPRTDVLSSTIPEDCAEDEDTSNSPQNSPSRQQQSKLPNTATSSRGTTLMNPSVRRPLSDSFGTERLTQPPNMEANKTGTATNQTSTQHKSNLSGQSVLNTNTKNSTATNRLLFYNSKVPPMRLPETFSKQNVKENVNSNQINNIRSYTNNQIKTDNHNRMLHTEFKSPQLIMQQQSLLNACTPKRQSNEKTKTNYYNGSPGRYILGTLESKSPSPTLETAL